MKKNNIVRIALGLITASAMLAACQKIDDPRGPYIPKEEDEDDPTPTEAPVEAEPTPTEAEPEPTQAPVKSAQEVPELVMSERYKNFDADNNGYELSYTYELLHTGIEYGKSHPGLRDSLEEVAFHTEEMLGESCSGYAELLSAMSAAELEHEKDMGEYPKYFYNRVYTRRADENVLSFMYENTFFDLNGEYDDVCVRAYNYYVEDGSVVEFSDVVADEEAFYDLLSEKLSVAVHEGLMGMQDYPVDAGRTRKEMLEYMDMGEYSWVLEPQGISFYFDTFTFMPWVASATVLFSEDVNGDIFTGGPLTTEPDEWVMKLPKDCTTVFDAEDDGISESIRVYDLKEPNRGGDYHFKLNLGAVVDLNNNLTEIKEDEEDQPYDYEAYLVHKDGKTVLLLTHDEYDFSYMDTYTLSGGEISHVDESDAGVQYLPEQDCIWGEEVTFPVYVITQSHGIPVYDVLNLETWECRFGELSIGSGGELSAEWE